MGRLKSYSFKADPKEMEVLDQIARELKTSRGALIRAGIANVIIGYLNKKEPRKMRVLA
jgi:predicted transcriptional regulator